MSVVYHIYSQPAHFNSPKTWALWREDGSDDFALMAHSATLADVLKEIEMDNA